MVKQTAILFTCLSFISVACFAQTAEIDSLKKVLSAIPDDSTKVETLIALSKEYFSQSPEEAIVYATHAKELAEKINYKKGVAYALKYIGIVHYIQEDHKEAVPIWEQSLAVFESIGDKVGISNIYNNLGALYADQGDVETAMVYYLKSLKGGEETNDTLRIISACTNIGETYANKSHTYDLALEYFQRALTLSEKTSDSESVQIVTINMGDLYFKKNNDTLALKYLERSLKAFPDSLRITGSLNYIGKVYRKWKEYKNAIEYHQQAYDFSKRLGFKLEMAQSLLGIAETQLQSGDVRLSITTYKQAEEIANELHDLKEIYEGLVVAYADQSDFVNAFKYQNLLIGVERSLYNIDTDKKLQGLQFKFDIEKKQTEISLLAKDNERQKLVRNGFMGGFAVVLLFAGVFFTQRNRISKEKKRSDGLLMNILPEQTAEELKATGTTKPKSFDSVTVMFTDFKNFTQASEKLSAEELVKEIHYCYSEFDRIITSYGIEKIKTIGDGYMCAGGLPVINATHPEDMVKAGLEIQQFIERNKQEHIAKGQPYFELRLGIHTGSAVAGVVGTKKYAYDIWGDAVNTASRMESSGEVGKVNISGTTYELVKDKFKCIHRGKVQAKNKGEVDMYFVESLKFEV